MDVDWEEEDEEEPLTVEFMVVALGSERVFVVIEMFTEHLDNSRALSLRKEGVSANCGLPLITAHVFFALISVTLAIPSGL